MSFLLEQVGIDLFHFFWVLREWCEGTSLFSFVFGAGPQVVPFILRGFPGKIPNSPNKKRVSAFVFPWKSTGPREKMMEAENFSRAGFGALRVWDIPIERWAALEIAVEPVAADRVAIRKGQTFWLSQAWHKVFLFLLNSP